MAIDPALPLQGALIEAIKSFGTAAGDNVFDTVPASNPYPRVTVGMGQSIPDRADCRNATESFVQIDAWSRAVGYPEVKRIADDIRDIIDTGDLTIDGHTLELLEIELSDYSRDPDGLTSRARLQVRVLTSPAN